MTCWVSVYSADDALRSALVLRRRRPGSRWEQWVAPFCVCSRSHSSRAPLALCWPGPRAGPLPGLCHSAVLLFSLASDISAARGGVRSPSPSRLSLSRVSREARCSRRIIGLFWCLVVSQYLPELKIHPSCVRFHTCEEGSPWRAGRGLQPVYWWRKNTFEPSLHSPGKTTNPKVQLSCLQLHLRILELFPVWDSPLHLSCNLKIFKCKMAERDHSQQAEVLHTHTHTQRCLVSLNIHLVNYSQPWGSAV